MTEKIFDAIEAGCVPVYWGSNNRPEQDILNPEAILFWTPEAENADVVRKISRMETDPALFRQFQGQERLLPDAASKIFEMYERLENKLKELIG